jgi:hypothetical protein
MRIGHVVVVLALAGCPQRNAGGPTVPLGAGCPAARDVHVASYVTPEEGGKGYAGWVLPLHDRVVDSAEGVAEYENLDAQAAAAAGVPAPPEALWMLSGREPCRATVGRYYAARVDAPTPNITYGVELAGCPAPPDPHAASAIVVVSERPPTECQLVAPRGVAQRLGEIDDKGTWSRPKQETPIPPEIARVLPARDCTPPVCEPLWSVAQVEVGGKTVAWAGALNWLEIPAGAGADTQCAWKAEKFSGFFVAGPDGVPTRITEGQNHPLALTAVLADKTGPRVLVAEGPGEYSTYDLANGAATLGRHLVWLRPHPDSYDVVDHLGPVCE